MYYHDREYVKEMIYVKSLYYTNSVDALEHGYARLLTDDRTNELYEQNIWLSEKDIISIRECRGAKSDDSSYNLDCLVLHVRDEEKRIVCFKEDFPFNAVMEDKFVE